MARVEVLYLSYDDVANSGLDAAACRQLVEEALRAQGRGETELPPKGGLYPGPNAFFHYMAARVPGQGAVGLKWVSYFPGNEARDLPDATGIMLLNDLETGVPLAIMDGMWITFIRTAAAAAVAASYLARPDSRVVALVGAGNLARASLPALEQVLPELREARVFTRREASRQRYRVEMQGRVRCGLVPVETAERAAEGADLILTTTSKPTEPILREAWLGRGATAVALDGVAPWETAALVAADKVVTDDWRYFVGAWQARRPQEPVPGSYAELGEIVAGLRPGRESPDERIMVFPAGVATEDVVVALRVYQLALERGLGKRLPL